MTKTHDLSSVLAGIKKQVSSYASERAALATSLRKVIGDAQKLLADLGEGASIAVKGQKAPAILKRTMSAAARKKLAAAAKKRWAAAHKAGKKHL